MGFSRQEYWGELPFPTPGALPDPGTEPVLASLALSGRFFTTAPPGNPMTRYRSDFKTSASSPITCHTDALWVCAHEIHARALTGSMHVSPSTAGTMG